MLVLGSIVFLGLFAGSLGATCTYGNNTYHAGESFEPNPCMHCYCSPSGETPCAITDCFFTMCVDAIHDPNQCCPVCPNGRNCQMKDGTIIKYGDTYSPNAHTTCSCPQNTFGITSQLAICVTTHTDPLVVP